MRMQGSPLPEGRWSAARISLIYLVVGCLWILLSDRLLFRWLFPGREALWVSVLKGLGFIGATAGMIYHLIRRDMRAIQQSQQALADRERQYRALFDEMNEGFALLEVIGDESGRPVDFKFREANRAFEKLTRRSRQSVVGRRVRDVLPNADPQWFETMVHVATTGEPVQFQRLASAIEMHLEAVAYRPAPGLVAVLFMDITRRKVLEEQLAQSAKMEAIGRLAGGIAHDFNNLLAVILGYSESMLRRMEEDSPLRGPLIEIDKAAQRGGALTRQLLDFARQRTVQLRPLDLNDVVTGLLGMLRGVVGREIQLRIELADSPHSIEADSGQMEQVIINLALNARDAMPHGGILSIRTAEFRLPNETAVLPGLRTGRYVLLQVEDTGTGMDADTQQRVFEPFFSTKTEGTGLGLSIVYGIIQQSGGMVYVHTRKGMGTRFDVYVPVAADALTPSAETVGAVREG